MYVKSKSKSWTAKSAPSLSMGAQLVSAWIFGVVVIFPLIIDDAYFNILPTKFYTYSIITGIFILSMLCYIAFSGGVDRWFEELGKKGFVTWFREAFDFTDLCLLGFIFVATISTLLAYPNVRIAFIGHYKMQGRYTGLFLLLLYTFAYFLVTRNYAFRRWLFTAFLIAGDLLCLLGITDYFQLDIFKFHKEMDPKQVPLFASTIGNINTYTTYVAFVVAFAGAMFVLSKVEFPKKGTQSTSGEKTEDFRFWILCLISMIIGFTALAMGKSDNGYLTLLTFFGILPFFAFRFYYGIRRYVLTLSIYLTIIKMIHIVNTAMPNRVLGLDGLYDIITGFRGFTAVLAVLWLLTAVLYGMHFAMLNKKNAEIPENAPKFVLYAWGGFFAFASLLLVFIIIYANTTAYENLAFLGGIRNYVVFSDHWGTERGYIWRASIEEYAKYPLLKQIFGTGPDTFGIYMTARRGNDMRRVTGQIYDSAHNEYIQYLTTIGITGLLAYLGFLVSAIVRGFRYFNQKAGEEKLSVYVCASAFLVLCYAVQASVNINLPISTPVMWLFLMIVIAVVRTQVREIKKQTDFKL